MSGRGRVTQVGVLVSLVACLGACGGQDDASVAERLWVSTVPTSPKQPITAFLATKAKDGKYIGAFFAGSMLRGGHDVFTWSPRSGGADITFLQDGSSSRLRFETCKPTRGFDHCVIVRGDPTGTGRYQSRKRWTTRRGTSSFGPAQLIPATIAALAEDDAELQALIEP